MAPSKAVLDRLERIALEAPNKTTDRVGLYETLFQSLAAVPSPDSAAQTGEDLAAVLEHAVAQSLGIISTRAVIGSFSNALLAISDPAVTVAAGTRALAALAPQQSSFVDQAAWVREFMAGAHEAAGDFRAAALVLAEIPLDTQQRRLTGADRARVWVRIARNFLEEDDAVSADVYVNKLMTVIGSVDPAVDADAADLTLHFKLCQARVQDAKREFLAASARYHEVSLMPAVAEDERLHTLAMAIKCAVLAPAGPVRGRLLGKLHRDERSIGLPDYPFLEKMLLDRLLTADEVDTFARTLRPHQLATTADGSTVLQKAVIEHNVIAVSRLYANISFDSLADRLGLDDSDKAEETVARMIEQGRLVGSMDQLERLVFFEGGEASGVVGSGRAQVPVGKVIRQWDVNIEGLAEEVENITNALQAEFPEFVQAQLQLRA